MPRKPENTSWSPGRARENAKRKDGRTSKATRKPKTPPDVSRASRVRGTGRGGRGR